MTFHFVFTTLGFKWASIRRPGHHTGTKVKFASINTEQNKGPQTI